MADGTVVGQTKTIIHDVDGGVGTVTPTTKSGFTSAVLTDVGDCVVLMWTTTRGWVAIGGGSGSADDLGTILT